MGTSPHHAQHEHDSKDKPHSNIEIAVNSDWLTLKGTGVDVEPALLSGHIALYLTESTSIKEITLQFRGKARLPTSASDTSSSGATYVVCNHDWSFLEGEKRHSHTLKAGRHVFPFQLQIGGSLPSSIATAFGGASINYKLRAVAVRPGFAHNMQAILPLYIMRSFAPEALEYQQTLEIENTWPEKLMYSLMIPHKAWAIGDKITAIAKFSPLAKGAKVLSVSTVLNETTKITLPGRVGPVEHTRSVVNAKHDILNHKAVPVIEQYPGVRVPVLAGSYVALTTTASSIPPNPTLGAEHRSRSTGSISGNLYGDLALRIVPTSGSGSSNEGVASSSSSSQSGPQPSSSTAPTSQPSNSSEDLEMNEENVVTPISITIPHSATPSHALDPIHVSHRIRWSILISNLDGHTSELRCSLPVHIIDYRLFDEVALNTAATRRLLLEGPDTNSEESPESELPSYPAHVRDRIANMYLPDAATVRVTNPWVASHMSPTNIGEQDAHRLNTGPWTPSGASSPLSVHPATSHLPHQPQSGGSTPLDWVNSELLLSLSGDEPPRPTVTISQALQASSYPSPPHSNSDPTSPSLSRGASRRPSRRPSRAPSPERHLTMSSISSSALPATMPAAPETYVHNASNASRNMAGVFTATLKPLNTSLAASAWRGAGGYGTSRSNSYGNLASLAPTSTEHRVSSSQQPHHPSYPSHAHSHSHSHSISHIHSGVHSPAAVQSPSATIHGSGYFPAPGHSSAVGGSATGWSTPRTMPPTPALDAPSESALWHRAFTEVPDYDVAARGFIGGVPPLSSMQGLPSYEEAGRDSPTGGSGSTSPGARGVLSPASASGMQLRLPPGRNASVSPAS
ncbi:hypothetical protein CONPUDRAFT_81390 [Coniophora puteana RWD-64-598 SS2]|uniref:Arrestin C-terminal-like domain-containing protein n=1 Tax=Coniophora puteana (strain RWD-64-598) TaxID=741705 RepID=A0A5M3MXF1_CONPW|nr:uncharacterized protein CONPUDRAFT_81390 [Coniophora puteana RWD-64-598 SS2]EIW83454.1 hypothetical protein CONPUDRAFT_81390 [Coniophora puteana RWD-64-598 SS2]